jgi:5-oxopent-3-ene-1,2,5-tricarboxylate decarboxylase/2-hydroxyhepta-2,4-diene-1,7-dioate isomerase
MKMTTKLQGKVVCVALNDKQQLEGMKDVFEQAPYANLPTEPVLYFKPHNTWNNSSQAIDWPTGDTKLVVGASLAVIIGERCCRVSEEQAMSYIEGFSIFHDFSLPEQSYYRPDIKGKCIDNSATLSEPVLVSDLKDVEALELVTSVNGDVKQRFPISRQQRSIAQIINKVSYIMTLEKGDVIAVGFAGDRVELSSGASVVSQLGDVLSLSNDITGAQA